MFALRKLLDALAPLVGAEASASTALKEGWADGASDKEIEAWAEKGQQLVKGDMERMIQEGCSTEYARLMRLVCFLLLLVSCTTKCELDSASAFVRPTLPMKLTSSAHSWT